MLENLCHAESLLRLEAAVECLNPRDRRNFLGGFRLAVATPLFKLLQFVVGSAPQLSLEYDDRLNHWLFYGFYKRRAPLLAAVTDLKTDLARLCLKFDDLFSALRTSGDELDEAIRVIQLCGEFGSSLRASLGKCEVVLLRDGMRVSDGDSLLRPLVAERVSDYSWRLGYSTNAYRLVWGVEEELPQPNEEDTLNALTHLDDVLSWPQGKNIPERWHDGLYFGFDSVIRMEGISLTSHSASGAVIVDCVKLAIELEHFVKSIHPDGTWPSMVYGLGEFTYFSKDELMSHLPESETVAATNIPSKDRLAAILVPDTVRLFTPGSFADFMDLEIFVAGAVSTHPDTQVEILVATHSVESDDRNWVSIAVRCRRETFIANHSMWYLFFKMYHEGPVFDSDVGQARAEVEGLLARLEGSLNITRIDDISDRDLLSYCEASAFQALRELHRSAVDVNSKLRAGVSELLGAFWLQARGYNNVHVSLENASLGAYEYDVVGVKDGKCLIVEVKGGSVSDEALQEEVIALGHKAENLRGRLPALAKVLSYEGNIDQVSALFVSLANSEGLEFGGDSVLFWDYKDFVNELKAVSLPSRLVGLLEQGHIIRYLDMADFFKELREGRL